MEDQRRDIGIGVCFLALLFYSLIFSVRCQSVQSMTLGVSPNMTVHQEGTTVSLLCQVSGFNASNHYLSWVKVDPIGTLIAYSKGLYVSDKRYRVNFKEGVISTFNLTFSEVQTTDTGTYVCNFIHQIDETSSTVVLRTKIVLSVYPLRDAFPSCRPNGPETLTVGSPISCNTSGIATPSIYGEKAEWTFYLGQNGEAVLLKNVTTLDNSQTYFCVAKIPASAMNLSCTIGPLNVVDIESTIPPKITTITVVKAGLSVGPITGIAIGVVLIIVAIHTLCCRETSQAREDTSTSPPDVPMSREGDDVPRVYCSVLGENSVRNSQPGLPSNLPVEQEKDTSSRQAHPYINIADKNPSQYQNLNFNRPNSGNWFTPNTGLKL